MAIVRSASISILRAPIFCRTVRKWTALGGWDLRPDGQRLPWTGSADSGPRITSLEGARRGPSGAVLAAGGDDPADTSARGAEGLATLLRTPEAPARLQHVRREVEHPNPVWPPRLEQPAR
jgi:hypothetical protein